MSQLLAIGIAIAAMAVAYNAIQQSGVRKEQVRVEQTGQKIHAKATAARKKVAAKPPAEVRSDLRQYCVDCAAK